MKTSHTAKRTDRQMGRMLQRRRSGRRDNDGVGKQSGEGLFVARSTNGEMINIGRQKG